MKKTKTIKQEFKIISPLENYYLVFMSFILGFLGGLGTLILSVGVFKFIVWYGVFMSSMVSNLIYYVIMQLFKNHITQKDFEDL